MKRYKLAAAAFAIMVGGGYAINQVIPSDQERIERETINDSLGVQILSDIRHNCEIEEQNLKSDDRNINRPSDHFEYACNLEGVSGLKARFDVYIGDTTIIIHSRFPSKSKFVSPQWPSPQKNQIRFEKRS